MKAGRYITGGVTRDFLVSKLLITSYGKSWEGLPVFKLVAPDGTGGSRETILRSIHRIFVVVKQTNFLAYVAHMTIKDPWLRGSYNYSETVSAGFAAHQMRDVAPHSKYSFPNAYINPPEPYPFSLLSERVFPEKVNNELNPLAKQV